MASTSAQACTPTCTSGGASRLQAALGGGSALALAALVGSACAGPEWQQAGLHASSLAVQHASQHAVQYRLQNHRATAAAPLTQVGSGLRCRLGSSLSGLATTLHRSGTLVLGGLHRSSALLLSTLQRGGSAVLGSGSCGACK